VLSSKGGVAVPSVYLAVQAAIKAELVASRAKSSAHSYFQAALPVVLQATTAASSVPHPAAVISAKIAVKVLSSVQ